MERENEIELARELLAGNPAAFDRFVEHFRSKIFQYSWLMCGHREDAEEVAQETLLKVFENFDQLREPERVRSWVFRIARNACLMKRRKSVYAPAQELSLDEFLPAMHHDGDQVKIEIADWSGLPDAQVLRSELRGRAAARPSRSCPIPTVPCCCCVTWRSFPPKRPRRCSTSPRTW